MSKCSCSIHAGNPFGTVAPLISVLIAQEEVAWPQPCCECGKPVMAKEAGRIFNFKEGIAPMCNTCDELVECFLCSCSKGKLWNALRYNYTRLAYNNLYELVSKEAADFLLDHIDTWIEEDNNNELLES